MKSEELVTPKHLLSPRDRLPLTLDCLGNVRGHITIDQRENKESIIQRLTKYYLTGFQNYAKRKHIFNDLPHKDLWPEKFENAYSWMQDAYNELEGTPQLAFGELITNVDMHGRGFRGATAAWINPSTFLLRVADKGLGFGSSDEHGDGIGHTLISSFTTEPIRLKKQKNGFILGICRDLSRVELPDQTDIFGIESIAPEISFIQQRRAQGKHLPQYHPNSSTGAWYDKFIGKFGGQRITNRLGKVIAIKEFTKEPEPWD